MLSQASEPCEIGHIGGFDRVFGGIDKIVVDCGSSRASISGKGLLDYARANAKKKRVIFCLSFVWIHFNLPTFRNWEKIQQLSMTIMTIVYYVAFIH